MDIISDGGEVHQNKDGIYEISRPDGKHLLVADLVNEESREKLLLIYQIYLMILKI